MGTIRAVGSRSSAFKVGSRVCCLYPHNFDTAIVVNGRHCALLSADERAEDVLSQTHPLVTSLHVATLLRLQPGDQVLVDCRQAHLASIISQVALLKGASAHITTHSETGQASIGKLGEKARFVDRQVGLQQALSGTVFDAILTDSKDEFQLLDSAIKSGGRILALANSVPVDLANAAVSFLSKGVTVGVFDPIDAFATAPAQYSR